MANSGYIYLEDTPFTDPFYEKPADIALAFYMQVNSDMIGVVPTFLRKVATDCRVRPSTIEKILRRFVDGGKAVQPSTYRITGG